MAQLAAAGVAAALRLGRWDLLARYLPVCTAASARQHLSSSELWETGLAQLLTVCCSLTRSYC